MTHWLAGPESFARIGLRAVVRDLPRRIHDGRPRAKPPRRSVVVNDQARRKVGKVRARSPRRPGLVRLHVIGNFDAIPRSRKPDEE
jgi:hypothetical protein